MALSFVPLGAQGDGFKPLFDGKTLNGWRGYKKRRHRRDLLEGRERDRHAPRQQGRGHPRRRDIITDGTYDEFDLKWEWKIAEGGNSGVKYFVMEDEASAIGHEYQMIDDERHPDAKIGPHRQTAALYDVFPAADRPIKPAGEWNNSEVIVKGNARRALAERQARAASTSSGSPELKAAIAKSKFKDIARFGTPSRGTFSSRTTATRCGTGTSGSRPLT